MSAIGLGRRARSAEPPARYLMARQPTALTYRHWSSPGVLDQGSTAQCVVYAGFKYLTSGPVVNRRPKETPLDLYRQCLLVDEWPGEDMEGGTSTYALFKVLKSLGYIGEYNWAYDAETAVNHILTRGPVVVGTSWLGDMFTPHIKTGYISATGEDGGGHDWLIVGANIKQKNPDGSVGACRMINSWGRKWGRSGGRAWITIKDLDKLLKEGGEACVASEIKISALEPMSSFA